MVSLQVATALGTIGVYLLVILAIGYRGWQVGTLDVEDWMAGGRGLGIVVLLFTYTATYHSAFAFVGASGFIYANGMGLLVPIFLWVAFSGILLWVVGSRIWLLGKKYGYLTPSDLLSDFYDSDLLGKLVSLVLILFTFPYITVQMIGSGVIFETATDGVVSFELGAAILLAAGVLYVWLGGLRAVAWTDTVQGVFMFMAIWVAGSLVAFSAFNGPAAFWTEVTANFAEHVTLPGPNGVFAPEFYVTWWIALGLGILMQPHVFLRFYAARSPRILKWVAAGGTAYLLLFYLPVPYLALGAVEHFPDLANADSALPQMLFEFTPVWFASIVVAGAIAAAMSTADSQLHAVSALITRDWYEDFASDDVTTEQETRFAQFLVPVLGLIAYVIAIQDVGFIVDITSVAIEGSAQVFPLVMGALYWENASKEGAISGFVLGVLVTAGLTFGVVSLPDSFPGFASGFYGLIVTSVVFMVVSLVVDAVPEENRNRTQGYLRYAINREWESEDASTPADD